MKDFRELMVWQKGIDIVEAVYQIASSFPKEEMYALSSQIKRSAVSIPSNIAEGFGRKTTSDFIHFLHISRGSLYELQTQLEIAKRINFIKDDVLINMVDVCKEEEKMLNGLIKSLVSKNE